MIDLWPDYDRSAVLVLITGNLPIDTALPAQVTIPLPQNATLNAVARISDEGDMIDDIEFENDSGTLTLITPDNRFRVEYYLPYSADGLQREFTFNWPGGPSVSRLDMSVQQPLAATNMNLQPEPESVITGSDGLQYHNLPLETLQVAEAFTVQGSYRLSSNQLTASDTGNTTGSQATSAGAADEPGFAIDSSTGLAVAGVILLLAAIGWQVFGARMAESRRPPRKPRSAHATQKIGAVRFCHQCGAKAGSDARFCRECGAELKKG